jgi:hypothetical protein
MRSTAYAIPNTNDLIKQSHIPIALSISPLAALRSDEVNIFLPLILEIKIDFFV